LLNSLFKKPVIVTDYPVEIKAFYMRLNDDEKTVRAMDILAPKIGEIIGGSQREERLDRTRAQNSKSRAKSSRFVVVFGLTSLWHCSSCWLWFRV
jgi:aspartyl/asparaginyl-tRNA synthetase